MEQYLIKSKGFRQLYSDLDKAKKDYEALKKRFLKEKNPFKIEIYKVEQNGDIRLIESVVITENSPLLED